MSIVDAFAEALEEADRLATHPGRGRSGPFKNWHPTVQESWRTRARSALRSVKPEDITDRMVDVFNTEMLQHIGDLRSGDERKKSAIAAAIAAGASGE